MASTEQHSHSCARKSLKVLIPVDGSEHSERAFNFYCERMHRHTDEVLIAHCIDLPPVPLQHQFPYGYDYLAEWQREADQISTRGKVLLHHFKCKFEDKYTGQKPRLIQPDEKTPSRAICDLAKNENVNIIVLGARGMGKIRRTVLGSVSDYVVHHAHIPVVVVPDDRHHYHHHYHQHHQSKEEVDGDYV